MTPKKGDLVFLPSAVTLIKMECDNVVDDFVQVNEPLVVVVCDEAPQRIATESEPYYEVLYQGSPWLARKIDCKEV